MTPRATVPCNGPTCGAQILWMPTEHGGRAPLNPGPILCVEDRAGPVRGFEIRDGVALHVRGRRPAKGEPHHNQVVVEIHESHFVTCPDREMFRGRQP